MLKKIIAIYQLTNLLQKERGPFAVIEKGRAKVEQTKNVELSWLSSCAICLSFWTTLIVMFLPQIVIDALVLWGGTSLMFRLYEMLSYAVYSSKGVTVKPTPPQEDCGCDKTPMVETTGAENGNN